jgi:uncharacterized protein
VNRSWSAGRHRAIPRRALLAGLLGVGAAPLGGCRDETPEPVEIRIATGSPTAVYHAFGQSLAAVLNRELPGVRASVVVTAASAQNVELVGSGGAELGFTQADVLSADPTENAAIAGVARVYDDLLHLVTRAEGPIRSSAELRGRRVSVGAARSGTEITASRLLEVAGLRGAVHRVGLGLDDSVAALRQRRIDAFFFSGGLPVRAVEQLAGTTSVRLVDLGRWTEPLRRGYREVYVSRDVPRSVYGTAPVTTVANPNYLVVGAALDESLVHGITRLLMERREELAAAHPAAGRMSRRSAISTSPLTLHPGAAAYYRESKP